MSADWLIPELQPEHELTLEMQRREIATYDLGQARAMLFQLSELATRQDVMLRGAVGRIAELEARLLAHEKAPG